MHRRWRPGVFAIAFLCPALAGAEGPRIMINVEKPAQTLATPMMAAAAQPTPGVSGAALAIGNLIGVLLVKGANEARDRAAQERAQVIEQALSEIDLRRELADALRRELERSAPLKGAVLEEVQDVSDMEQPGLLVHVREPEIFTLDVRCSFDASMRSLQALSTVRLWRKDGAVPVYAARLRYVSQLLAADEEQASKEWFADRGALIARRAREGMAETARLFVLDARLRAPGAAALPESAHTASWPASGAGEPAPFHVVAERPDRVIGRAPKVAADETLSLPRESVTASLR